MRNLLLINFFLSDLFSLDPNVADVPGVGPVPLLAATPHPRVPPEHRLPLPRDALPASRTHRNGGNVNY